MTPGRDAPPATRDADHRRDLRTSLLLALATFAVAFALATARLGHGAPDFYVFWAAAGHWQAPYDPAVITRLQAVIHLGGTWPFAYPPSFLLMVWPFTLAPLTLAYPLWAGLTGAAFVFTASRLIRPAWGAAALLAAPPVFFSAMLGQTTLPIGAAMLGGWLVIDRRPALAGVLFALAACIKPQAMILAPVVLWGRWRTLAWMAGAGAAIVAASLVFGFERWLEWPRALASFRQIAPQADRANPSALIDGPWWSAATALGGGLFAWRNRNLLGMVGGAFLATPYAHAYDLAPLAPLAATWVFEFRRYGWGQAGAGACLLGGVIATPLAALAFFGAVALLTWTGGRWSGERPLHPSGVPLSLWGRRRDGAAPEFSSPLGGGGPRSGGGGAAA